jgi:glucan phosphoethanolaminetransferase (alkaline phosphatase superfamily)
MKVQFNGKYFALAILIFIIEVLIALYVHDQIIRPYIGDVLVVILIYCFVKAFFNFPVIKTAIGVLLFSYAVETLQYFEFVKLIGLEKNRLANVVIGNYFAWMDILAYSLGIVIVLLAEHQSLSTSDSLSKRKEKSV